MGTKLQFTHRIFEKRNFGKQIVNQEMVITADYEHGDHVEIEAVDIYENGKHVAEISKLLDKAEGSPLAEMMDAIDWDLLYAEKMAEARERYLDAIREEGI